MGVYYTAFDFGNNPRIGFAKLSETDGGICQDDWDLDISNNVQSASTVSSGDPRPAEVSDGDDSVNKTLGIMFGFVLLVCIFALMAWKRSRRITRNKPCSLSSGSRIDFEGIIQVDTDDSDDTDVELREMI
jgi:hypothetical protein